MGIVLKVVAILIVVVIGVGIIGSIIGVGVNLVRYMAKQGFDFQHALNWSWEEYQQWVQKINPFKATAEKEVYEFTNKNIDVVGCTSL